MLTESVPGVRSVSLGIWVTVGSRDESPEQAGAAHYLEHLLFKGTRRRSAAEIAEAFDAVGGELNAFTAKEHTCFYAHVLDTDLPMSIDVLADVVTDAVLEPAHVELERNVVLEEIAIRDDDPEDLLGELFDDAMFGDHPLGRPIVGTDESVRAMDRAVLHEFWRGRYTTPRMVVAAAGNLYHEHVVDLVAAALDRAASRAGRDAVPAPLRAADPPRPTGTGLALLSDDSEQAHLMIGVPGVSRHDPRRPALSALQHRARRRAELPAVPAGPRGARAGVLGVLGDGELRGRRHPRRVRRLRPRAARRGGDRGARRARRRRGERPDRRRAGAGARIAARRSGARQRGHPVADEPHRPL